MLVADDIPEPGERPAHGRADRPAVASAPDAAGPGGARSGGHDRRRRSLIRRGLDDDGGTDDRADDKIVDGVRRRPRGVLRRLRRRRRGAPGLRRRRRPRRSATAPSPDDVDGWVTSSAWLELLGDDADGTGRARAHRHLADQRGRPQRPHRRARRGVRHGPDLGLPAPHRPARPWSELGVDLPGRVAVGFPSADTATGLPVLASTAAGAFGSLDFASNDFDAEFRAELATLVGASGRHRPRPGAHHGHPAGQVLGRRRPPKREWPTSATTPSSLVDTAPVVDATIVVVPLRGADRPPSAEPAARGAGARRAGRRHRGLTSRRP